MKGRFIFDKSISISDPEKFGQALFELSRESKTSFSGISKLAVSYARQGLSMEEVLGKVRSDIFKDGN